MERLKRLLRVSPVTLILIGLVAWLWFRPPAWVDDVNEPAPDVTVRLIDGRPLTLSELRGKVVLVNFWATWCPYCRHEMPAIDEFYRDTRARGFEVLALSLDSREDEVVKFMRDKLQTTIKVINLLDEDIQSHVFGDIMKRQVIGEVRVTF